VDADLGGRVDDVAVGADTGLDPVHGEAAARVDDIDAVGAVGLHHFRLLGEAFGGVELAHHQEPGDVHAELAGGGDVLGGDVGLGAVGGHPDRPDADLVGAFEVVGGADAGKDQRCQPGVREVGGGDFKPLPVGVAARSVVQ